jgi:hypothetical protein
MRAAAEARKSVVAESVPAVVVVRDPGSLREDVDAVALNVGPSRGASMPTSQLARTANRSRASIEQAGWHRLL